jgi:hypothetical protein
VDSQQKDPCLVAVFLGNVRPGYPAVNGISVPKSHTRLKIALHIRTGLGTFPHRMKKVKAVHTLQGT